MKKYIILLTVLTLAISCTKEEEKGLDVSMTGFVKLINESGTELFERNGVKVTIQGSSTYTQTDKNGKFLFTGLKAGSPYSFDFSRDGYGTRSVTNYRFIGDEKPGLIGTVTLYQIPSIELKSASIQYQNNTISVSGQITPTVNFTTMAFANDSANVSDTHYDYWSGGYTYSGGFSSFQLSVQLTNNTYTPGTTIYVAVYFYNYYDGGYWDSEKNLTIRSSAKKAGTLKITL
jgi:hypothetical protein